MQTTSSATSRSACSRSGPDQCRLIPLHKLLKWSLLGSESHQTDAVFAINAARGRVALLSTSAAIGRVDVEVCLTAVRGQVLITIAEAGQAYDEGALVRFIAAHDCVADVTGLTCVAAASVRDLIERHALLLRMDGARLCAWLFARRTDAVGQAVRLSHQFARRHHQDDEESRCEGAEGLHDELRSAFEECMPLRPNRLRRDRQGQLGGRGEGSHSLRRRGTPLSRVRPACEAEACSRAAESGRTRSAHGIGSSSCRIDRSIHVGASLRGDGLSL
jgi:hypothetical protein